MTASTALSRLLAGSGCAAERTDPRTFVIRSAGLPGAAAAVRARAPEPRAEAGAPVQLGELVVTAERTEALLSRAPVGLTALSGATLARRGVADIRDLPLLAAGVTVTNLGSGRDKVLLRGLSDGPLTGHTQSTVGLYLGDLRLTYNAPDPNLPYEDIARVEVLRGPQGSLYGVGSIGGIVQAVPNAPDPSGRSGSVSAKASATAHGAPSFGGVLVANLPVTGTAAVRGVLWSEQTGGVLDNQTSGRPDSDRSRRQGARVTGLWRPSADLELQLTVVSQAIATRDAQYATGSTDSLERRVAVAEPHDNDFLAAVADVRWRRSWGVLRANVGSLDHEITTTYDASLAPPDLVPSGPGAPTYHDGNEIRGLVSEVRATSAGGARLRWTVGAFNAFGVQDLDSRFRRGAAVGYAEDRRDDLRESALFGEASYDLTPTLTLTAGGRAFVSELKSRSQVVQGGAPRAFAGKATDTGLAPKLRAAYRPADGLTLYVQAAEGYRTSGFNSGGPTGQVFGVSSGDTQPLRRYAGDELWSYEAGARWRAADGRFNLRAAAFEADWDDIQADLVLPSGLPFTANLGDGRSRGVEFEAGYLLGPLDLSASATLQDPELQKPAPGIPERRDAGLPGVPKVSFALGGVYGLDLADTRRLELSAAYAYVGRSLLTFDRATAPSMGGYGDLRLAADLQAGVYRVRITVENALDARGDTLAFGNPFSFRAQRETTPQRPRTLSLRVSRGL